MNLPDALLSRDATHTERATIAVGVVRGTAPLTVDYAGATGIPANRLTSYTPVTSDVVLILKTEARLVVLGKPA